MGEIVDLGRRQDEQKTQAREAMVEALEALLDKARAGNLASVCFVAIRTDRETLGFGVLHTPDCGIHEMVGATTILSDHLRTIVQQ